MGKLSRGERTNQNITNVRWWGRGGASREGSINIRILDSHVDWLICFIEGIRLLFYHLNSYQNTQKRGAPMQKVVRFEHCLGRQTYFNKHFRLCVTWQAAGRLLGSQCNRSLISWMASELALGIRVDRLVGTHCGQRKFMEAASWYPSGQSFYMVQGHIKCSQKCTTKNKSFWFQVK